MVQETQGKLMFLFEGHAAGRIRVADEIHRQLESSLSLGHPLVLCRPSTD